MQKEVGGPVQKQELRKRKSPQKALERRTWCRQYIASRPEASSGAPAEAWPKTPRMDRNGGRPPGSLLEAAGACSSRSKTATCGGISDILRVGGCGQLAVVLHPAAATQTL